MVPIAPSARIGRSARRSRKGWVIWVPPRPRPPPTLRGGGDGAERAQALHGARATGEAAARRHDVIALVRQLVEDFRLALAEVRLAALGEHLRDRLPLARGDHGVRLQEAEAQPAGQEAHDRRLPRTHEPDHEHASPTLHVAIIARDPSASSTPRAGARYSRGRDVLARPSTEPAIPLVTPTPARRRLSVGVRLGLMAVAALCGLWLALAPTAAGRPGRSPLSVLRPPALAALTPVRIL